MNSKFFKIIAVLIALTGIILGIVLGFACKIDIDTDWWYEKLRFNTGLMFETWIITDIIALLFGWMSAVLAKLENIERKFCENTDSSSKIMDKFYGAVKSTADKVKNISKNISNLQNSTETIHTSNATTWICPRCGKVNQNYLDTCSCGQQKTGV